jgi:transcriptional regulator with XRE-family HTH domain
MAGDGSARAKKKKWSDWLNARLKERGERGWNAADLVKASGDVLVYNTVYNWMQGTARVEAETTLIVAAALNVPPSEALNAASYPLFADAMQGKELRLVGAEAKPPDPGIMRIMAARDLTDEVKAVMIEWWKRRTAEEEERRLRDTEREIAIRTRRDSA